MEFRPASAKKPLRIKKHVLARDGERRLAGFEGDFGALGNGAPAVDADGAVVGMAVVQPKSAKQSVDFTRILSIDLIRDWLAR